MDHCIFCAIATHRSPAAIVYEDEATLAFMDIHPAARGHTLVIPRRHHADLYDLSDEAGAAVMRTTRVVAQALRAALAPDGLNLLQSNERAAGQSVFHFHLHLIPRWRGDGLHTPRHAVMRTDQSALDALAGLIRQKLSN